MKKLFGALFVLTVLISCGKVKEGDPAWVVQQVYLYDGSDFSEIAEYFLFGGLEEEESEEAAYPEELAGIWEEVTHGYTVKSVKVEKEKEYNSGKKLLLTVKFEDGTAEDAEALLFFEDGNWKLSVD